jgi:hypothetical protein
MTCAHEDITGRRFGRLLVEAFNGRNRHGHIQWRCRCDCGGKAVATRQSLRSGNTQSCGCLRAELLRLPKSHGRTRTRAYRIWGNMSDRCGNPKNQAWEFYGGRGIRVCERWKKFENFHADMGDPPNGHTLERKNVNIGYEPSNCIWLLANEQALNRRSNRLLTFNGRTQPMALWAKELGMSRRTLASRLRLGWSVDRALATPISITRMRNNHRRDGAVT